MKIVLNNEAVSNLDYKLQQVIGDVLGKTGADIEGYTIDADIVVNIKLKGVEEPQHIFTDRMILGKPEIFTVIPEYDETGALVGTEDNKESTFEALAHGLSRELPTEPVKSQFNDEDLTQEHVEEGGDLKEIVYSHVSGKKVVRYYRAGVGLVGELEATPKEE